MQGTQSWYRCHQPLQFPVERDDESTPWVVQERVHLQKTPTVLYIGTLGAGSGDGILEAS